ncbi:MAG: hypothetical protein RLZZ436_4723 [Planctomycetota bacterium]|jgi:hypothetical protein
MTARSIALQNTYQWIDIPRTPFLLLGVDGENFKAMGLPPNGIGFL